MPDGVRYRREANYVLVPTVGGSRAILSAVLARGTTRR